MWSHACARGAPRMIGRGLLERRGGGHLARSRTSSQAFGEFYESTAPGVLRYFARETRDAQRAFDLTAETFAKAFEKRRDFRGASDSQAAAWLWSIARTELAHYLRSKSVEFGALARLQLERPAPSDAELRRVEEMAVLAEVQDHLGHALSLLPEDQRTVIQMRFIDMLSYEQIAVRLGVSEEAVRARSSRAMRTLRANPHVHEAVRALEV
jgi:RNA polymerase sigma factor (sigma-70 family)